jgi:transmembrane sensor
MNNIFINDDIITKYLCGEASPEEAISLEDWLKESPENREYFGKMEQTFLLVSKGEKALPNRKDAWNKFQKNEIPKVKSYRWLYNVAAVLLVGMISFLFYLNSNKNQVSEIYASNNPVNKKLKDNSFLHLGKFSKVVLENGFGVTNRKLLLEGKADFKVVHDEKMPFIIESNGVFIEDLGTVFSVETEPKSDTVYVVVNEGIVRLYDEHGSEIIIKAGEKAWYIRSKKQIISSLDTKVVKFDFKDTNLKEVVKLLSETYDVNIKLQPEGIGNCRLTTQFFDEEIATIVTIISETLGFKYEYKGQQYIIQGTPCK